MNCSCELIIFNLALSKVNGKVRVLLIQRIHGTYGQWTGACEIILYPYYFYTLECSKIVETRTILQ
jgi:hypothetical protein